MSIAGERKERRRGASGRHLRGIRGRTLSQARLLTKRRHKVPSIDSGEPAAQTEKRCGELKPPLTPSG
ncbi:hypothetical protein T281_02470 [Rhodomicrobium udaipurense JA643]|nr:hypothetical protein T281_02470 [Rhodomicrobium udaipurense JA643]